MWIEIDDCLINLNLTKAIIMERPDEDQIKFAVLKIGSDFEFTKPLADIEDIYVRIMTLVKATEV